jgi:5-methylcytosine-specific restriction endonuclease McrA
MREAGLLNKSIADVRQKSKKQNALITIRNHARNVMDLSGRDKICIKCGYFKHVQVAHIKAIKDFVDSTTIREVNSVSNLMYLCPNCHWEHDHGL